MSMFTGIIVIVVAVILNITWVLISKRLDATPSVPNYKPDNGVNAISLKAVPEILAKYGIKAESSLLNSFPLSPCVKSFFDDHERLEIDYIIDLNRSYLSVPYVENDDFLRIGLMSCEDDLLVRKSADDMNIYIVGSEDGNPKDPELFATSFENLLAIACHDKNRLDAECL